jgi:hypothetical protein
MQSVKNCERQLASGRLLIIITKGHSQGSFMFSTTIRQGGTAKWKMVCHQCIAVLPTMAIPLAGSQHQCCSLIWGLDQPSYHALLPLSSPHPLTHGDFLFMKCFLAPCLLLPELYTGHLHWQYDWELQGFKTQLTPILLITRPEAEASEWRKLGLLIVWTVSNKIQDNPEQVEKRSRKVGILPQCQCSPSFKLMSG